MCVLSTSNYQQYTRHERYNNINTCEVFVLKSYNKDNIMNFISLFLWLLSPIFMVKLFWVASYCNVLFRWCGQNSRDTLFQDKGKYRTPIQSMFSVFILLLNVNFSSLFYLFFMEIGVSVSCSSSLWVLLLKEGGLFLIHAFTSRSQDLNQRPHDSTHAYHASRRAAPLLLFFIWLAGTTL